MRLFRPLLIALLVLLTVACSKVTMENYGKLKTGQSYDEVVTILGQPESCNESLGIRNCLWGSENKGIKVGFVGGMALTLSALNLK